MRFIFNFLLLFFTTFFCSAQKIVERDIQHLTITDTVLLSQIHNTFNEMRSSYEGPFKNGYGYINLYIQRFSPSSDTTAIYFLNPTLNTIEETSLNDPIYPDFYDIIDNKLVAIYMDILDRNYLSKPSFTATSKKKMRDLMDKYAAPTLPFDDGKGHKADARIHYLLFGGTKIYIKKSGPPIIRQVKEG